MKNILFAIYAFFFNLGAKIGVKENRIGLVSVHNASFKDSLGEVERVLKIRGNYEIFKTARTSLGNKKTAIRFITKEAFKLGRCRYIFLNDNFMPLSRVKPGKHTEIVQLWHGQGAFKKFGLHIPQPDAIRTRELAANAKLSYVVCSSENVKHIYAEAFGVPLEKVIATGSPNEDSYFRNDSVKTAEQNFFGRFPQLRGKYLVLYAPTFREDKKADAALLAGTDFVRLKASFDKYLKSIGDAREAEILVRLHPQIHGRNAYVAGARNVTFYENVNELCLMSDLLITDYSSICMDFSLQNKPMLFYAFDLAKYKDSRNFYFDYEAYVPGPVAQTMDALCDVIEKGDFQAEKNTEFRKFNFGAPDGTATEQLLAKVLKA